MEKVKRPRYTDTHCAKGHELTEENLIRRKGGIRCRKCHTKSQMNVKYGKGAGDYAESKYIEQEGKCALCDEFYDVLCLDHDHTTGQWRGLVCKFCNLLIGWVEDRNDKIEKAKEYLIFYRGE